MNGSICGIDCTKCEAHGTCGGCVETKGRPFGSECVVASRFKEGESFLCEFKKDLIAAFNSLNIKDMERVTQLNALKGSFANVEYALPNGRIVKFWDDNKIYLGNLLRKKDGDGCYGIIADEKYLMVSEFGDCGSDAEILIFQRWR